MLQHAQNQLQTATNSSASALDRPQGRPPDVTYGALLDASREASSDARRLIATTARESALAAPSIAAIANELEGYERFLLTATRHVRTLLRIAEVQVATHWAAQLDHRREDARPSGHWNRAADTLAAAHDLLASHYTTVLLPRSAEARDGLIAPGVAGTCTEVTAYVLEAIGDAKQLVALASRARREQRELAAIEENAARIPIRDSAFSRLREANRSTAMSARSTMWELRDLVDNGAPTLRHLQPALTVRDMRSTTFDSNLKALRVLREIARRQAAHATPASPASLRDLTLIASRVLDRTIEHTSTDPGEATTHGPCDGIEALRRAHTRDLLEEARTAWHEAGTDLTTRVRGITRAPAAYAMAATTLSSREPTEGEQRALLTSLPALAHDASLAVEQLTSHGSLATPQLDPLATHEAWRPITGDQGHQLSARFTRAEQATRRATTAWLALGQPKSPIDEPVAPTTHPRVAPRAQIEGPSCIR